jgi:hypothetical protein
VAAACSDDGHTRDRLVEESGNRNGDGDSDESGDRELGGLVCT